MYGVFCERQDIPGLAENRLKERIRFVQEFLVFHDPMNQPKPFRVLTRLNRPLNTRLPDRRNLNRPK